MILNRRKKDHLKIMKSKANFKGHPIHQILVVFPIAFFTGALLSDLYGALWRQEVFLFFGKVMAIAGIFSGIIAAIPGIIDYVYTVPPKSSGKERALNHGILNTSTIILFLIALILRHNAEVNILIIPGIELSGVILLVYAGWLGGTLVIRNQIGIDIRYAGAGKWKESFIKSEDGKLKIENKNIPGVNQMALIHVQNKRIVLGKTENKTVIFDDRCTHRGGSLAAGTMVCGTVQCPWHGSQFDVCTGAVKAGPAKDPIKVYGISNDDGIITADLKI